MHYVIIHGEQYYVAIMPVLRQYYHQGLQTTFETRKKKRYTENLIIVVSMIDSVTA